MTFKIDEDFDFFLEEFGKPSASTKVNDITLEKYQHILPKRLLEYWKEFGFCSFSDGLLDIVNPDDYSISLKNWLLEFHKKIGGNYYVIAKSGFGDLFLWSKENGHGVVVKPRNCCIFLQKGYDKEIMENKEDEEIMLFFGIQDPETIDLEDVDTDKPIFADAVKKFGPLAPDEMFTFEPALFLGGEQTLNTINKVNIFVQLELLAKMGTPQIMDINGLAKKAFSQ